MENKEKKKTTLDDILTPLGGFGRFQITVLVYISLMSILCAICELSYVITTSEVKHRCLIPECETPDGALYNSSQPWLSNYIHLTSKDEFELCLRQSSDNSSCNSFTNESIKCNEFVYETEEWTIAREDWDIHCDDDRWQLTLLGSLNNAGQVMGGLFIGFISDRFGRKTVLVSLTILVSIFGIIKSFSVNFAMMGTLEFFEASMGAGLFNNCFVLALEIVDPSKRVLAGTVVSCVYPIGEILLGAVQMGTLHWRTSLRILYAPGIIAIIFYWTLPESVRWLMNNKENESAVVVLKKIAAANRKTLPDEAVRKILNNEVISEDTHGGGGDTKAAVIATLKSKRLRLRFIASLIVWVGTVFIYFGLTINSVSLSDDKFVNLMLIGFIEIPAYIVVALILDRLGRRICMTSALIICGVCLVLSAFVPDDDEWSWAQLVLYLAGKFAASGAFMVGDIFTIELFPTPVRAAVMAITLMTGKLASIVAPQIPLLADIYTPLPLLVLSLLAFISGAASLVFPETLGLSLPDTVEEAEQLGQTRTKESR